MDKRGKGEVDMGGGGEGLCRLGCEEGAREGTGGEFGAGEHGIGELANL